MEKKYEYILACAESKSISKAAERLYVTQPYLSRFITKIEDHLGQKLFYRNGEGIRLTPAGDVYVRYAREMRQLQSKMEKELCQLRNEEQQDEIVVCMTLNATSLSTAMITARFHERFPGCRLTFVNTLSMNLQNMLDEQRCDFAIGPDVVNHNQYILRRLNNSYMLLAVPVKYDVQSMAQNIPELPFPWIDVKKCAHMDFLFQELSCNARKDLDLLLKSEGLDIKPVMEFTNSILLIQAIEKQLGCGFISEEFIPYIADREKMRCYCVGERQMLFSSYAIYARSGKLTQKEEYCIKLIKEHMKNRAADGRRYILGTSSSFV